MDNNAYMQLNKEKVLLLLVLLLFIPYVSATKYEVNGTVYYPLYNGTYSQNHIEKMDYNFTTGDFYMSFDSGKLRLLNWTGGWPNDYVLNPENDQPVSMWSGWKAESYRTSGQGSWIEMTPLTHQFVVIDEKTLMRSMTTISGGKLNVTYKLQEGKLKFIVNRTAGTEGRAQRVRYEVDFVNGMGTLNTASKRFNPGFNYTVSTLWDYSDIPSPASFGRIWNRTTGQYEGTNSTWRGGYNLSEEITQGGTRYNLNVYLNGSQIMQNGNSDEFDPTWQTNGNTTPVWINTSLVNTTVNYGLNKSIELDQNITNPILYMRADGTALNDNRSMSSSDGTGTIAYNTTQYKYGQAYNFQGSSNYVSIADNASYTFNNAGQDQPFSITGWINMRSISATQGIISKWTASQASWIVYTDGSRIFFEEYQDSVVYIGRNGPLSSGTSLNKWNFFAFTYNGSETAVGNKIYLNGTRLDDTSSSGGSYSGLTDKSSNVELGRYNAGNYFNGIMDDIKIFPRELTLTEIQLLQNQTKYTSGNITTWYDSGSGNETYQIDVNITTPANTNYILSVYNNDTLVLIESWINLTGNQSKTITGTKAQDTKINITLFGGTTATPELMGITFYSQTAGVGSSTYIPPSPTSCSSQNGTTWINVSCSSGSGNITDGMNFTKVSPVSWQNGTQFYQNFTGLSEGTAYDFRVYAWNSSGGGTLNQTYVSVSNTTQVTLDVTPPASISNYNMTSWNFGILNQWTNPISDFDHIEVRNITTDALLTNLSNTSWNRTLSPHYTQNISMQTVDSSGNVNQTKVWFNTTIPNNIPILASIGSKSVVQEELLSFSLSGSDGDSDSIACSSNESVSGSLTGCDFSWTPNSSESGLYDIRFYYNDSYGGSDYEDVSINVTSIPTSITYVIPTPENGSTNRTGGIVINVSTSNIQSVSLDWNNTLSLWLRFNESSGATTIEDSSGYHNNGTALGSYISSVGKYGLGGKFDGTNDNVTIPVSSSLNLTKNYTISGWLKPNTSATNGYILAKNQASSGDIEYAVHRNSASKNLNFYVNGVLELALVNDTCPDNVWTHFAFIQNGTHLLAYINGTLNTTVSYSTAIVPTSQSLLIGNRKVSSLFYNGYMDDIRIYKRVLTVNEVQSMYNLSAYPLNITMNNLLTGSAHNATAYGEASTGVIYSTEKRFWSVDLADYSNPALPGSLGCTQSILSVVCTWVGDL